MDLIEHFIQAAQQNPVRIVYPEAHDERILRAAVRVSELKIARPILVGNKTEITCIANDLELNLAGIDIQNNQDDHLLNTYADLYIQNRKIKPTIARRLIKKPLSFAGMMVKVGAAEGMVAGVANATTSVIQAASLTIGFEPGMSIPSSFFIMIIPDYYGQIDYPIIFADCAVNIDPTSQELAEIAIASGENAEVLLGVEPRIALLSFATQGSANHTRVDKVRDTVAIAREKAPHLLIDGEFQADAALMPRVAAKKVQDSLVAGSANVLIFPDLDSGNISYKLVQYLAGSKAIGPILQGFASPVNDMSRGASIEDLIAVTAITVVQAQNKSTSS